MRLIVTGDNHLRPDMPLCRTDPDWIATQRGHLEFIVDKCNERSADLLCTGDLFDVPRVPPEIVNMFLEVLQSLNGKCYVIAGNHCLPWHKEENLAKSSIGVLKALSKTHEQIVYLDATEETVEGRFEHTAWFTEDILVAHTLTFPNQELIPFGASATTAYALIEKYPKARLILTGDYHHNFVFDDDGHVVVNPGCMNIQVADMMDYAPGIYFVDTDAYVDVTAQGDTNKVFRWKKSAIEWIPMPNDVSVLTRNHLDVQRERDSRIASFVETIMHDKQIGLSFENNLRAYMDKNQLRQPVRDILQEVEEE